jgi:hypothetical protein
MVTEKERTLVWEREDQETRARAERDLERDEEELVELEILFVEVRLERPSRGVEKNVADTEGWKTVSRKLKRCEGGPNKSTMAGFCLQNRRPLHPGGVSSSVIL